MAPDPATVSWINPGLTAGETRKVMTGIPGKTGVVYTLDRATGEFLWATPIVPQNVITDIDGATGAVTPNGEIVFTAEGQEVLACPSWFGGKDREAGAYSPLTNTMYMPLRNVCARMLASTDAGSHYALAVRNQITPGMDQVGTVQAISAETGETRWLHSQRSATMSLVATGGGRVFGGDVNGRLRAFDQEMGEVLWEINLGSAVTSFPISYAVDGRQYVAVGTGSAGTAPGFLGLTPELRMRYDEEPANRAGAPTTLPTTFPRLGHGERFANALHARSHEPPPIVGIPSLFDSGGSSCCPSFRRRTIPPARPAVDPPWGGSP